MLPLLTVLFLISYGLMTMLIVEQGQTIESQRALIRELFRDSTELTANKMKALKDKAKAGTVQSSPNAQSPSSSQKQSSQSPSAQAQPQTPSSQVAPRRSRSQNEKEKQLYRTPPRPATDQADDARNVLSI